MSEQLSVAEQALLRRRARQLREQVAEIAVYKNWPQDEVQRIYRALGRLDFQAVDDVLKRLDT